MGENISPMLEDMNTAENKNAEYWVNKGDESCKAKNYEDAVKCYDKAALLDPNKAFTFDQNKAKAFYDWGNAFYKLAEIKRDEALFESASKNFKEAAYLYETDIDKAFAFYDWGNALSSLANIKQDVILFESAFEKYEEAIKLEQPDNDKASVFHNWGYAILKLAEIKQDETIFESALKKIEEAARLFIKKTDKASAFFNWGYAFSSLAEMKQDKTLFESAFEKFEEATLLYETDTDKASTLHVWGYAILNLAEMKQDKTLFESAFEKFEEATLLYETDTDKANAFHVLGYAIYSLAKMKQDVLLFKEACEKYDKTTQLDPNTDSAFYNWGHAILNLAEIKQDEDFNKHLKIFEKASMKINDPDTLLIKGELYFVLYQTEKKQEYEEKVKECFKKSKKSVLEILSFLDKKNRRKIFNETKFLHSLLEFDNNDADFFRETTKNLTQDQTDKLDEYKEVYIRSIFIISLLHVNDANEKIVAHYREKNISLKLLFDSTSKFRLNAIDYSNDPSEGKTLLDFLYGEKNRPSDEELNNEEYEAFASCFVFDYDNLNMFRLYGKEHGKEGSGLSLVFQDGFFSKEAKMALGSPKTDSFKNSNNSIEKDKLALFRCIYIDPNSRKEHHMITVGRKEKYLFYREEKGKEKYDEYDEYITDVIKQVNNEMKILKGQAEKLDHASVGKLLVNLRYLVKHIAFKEEQECRIVKIHRLHDKEIKIKNNDYKQMYIEYSPVASKYIVEIYFGPKAIDFELFKSILKNKELNIRCEKSKNPLM